MEAKAEKLEKWEKSRIFVRGIEGDYDLTVELKRLKNLPRVIKGRDIPWEGGPRMWNRWLVHPKTGITQSLMAHMKEMVPGSASQKHGHQNDAMIYILEGQGYEIHDEKRYDWEAGDVVIVHPGCVHQHFVTGDKPAKVLIIKGKPAYNFMNLLYQGLVEPASKEPVPGWENYQPQAY
jgi:quercetin dioxygenase-like cupin family protein